MLQKNKVFALGLLLVSGVIQTSFASDKGQKVKALSVGKVFKKLNTRYSLPVDGSSELEEGATQMKNSSEFKSLSAKKQGEVYNIIVDHYNPGEQQKKFSILSRKLSSYGLKDDAAKKIDQGVVKLKMTPAYKKLSVAQKQDVHSSVAVPLSCFLRMEVSRGSLTYAEAEETQEMLNAADKKYNTALQTAQKEEKTALQTAQKKKNAAIEAYHAAIEAYSVAIEAYSVADHTALNTYVQEDKAAWKH